MKVIVKLLMLESYDKFIFLDEKEMVVEENMEKMVIETMYKDRINTLISLFSLKKEWKASDIDNCLYNVIFENDGIKEIYSFNEVPDNWNMFMGYLFRLVGDTL
jgi:hypothetical protein